MQQLHIASQHNSTTLPLPITAVARIIRHDFVSRLEHRRRCRDLREFAQTEQITLPMPPEWIATLEALGFVVDLITGEWSEPAEYWPGPALPTAPASEEAQFNSSGT